MVEVAFCGIKGKVWREGGRVCVVMAAGNGVWQLTSASDSWTVTTISMPACQSNIFTSAANASLKSWVYPRIPTPYTQTPPCLSVIPLS